MNQRTDQLLVLKTLKERLKFHKSMGNEDLIIFMEKRIRKIEGEYLIPGYPGFRPKKIIL